MSKKVSVSTEIKDKIKNKIKIKDKIKNKIKDKIKAKAIKDNIFWNLHFSAIAFVYIIPLLILSPYLDNLFGPLNKDKTYIYILGETAFHLLVLILFYVYKRKLIDYILSKIYGDIDFNFYHQDILLSFISSIILVGSQKNLITKIRYLNNMTITYEIKNIFDTTNVF